MCYKSPCPRGSSAAALEKQLLLSMRHWQLLWQHLGAPRHSSAQKGEHLGHTGAAGSWAGSPRTPCHHTVTSGQQPTAGWLSRSAHGSTAQVPGCRGTLGTGGLWAQGKAAHRGTGGTGISVLPHWHSIPREDFPHQLQPQQKPGLDFTSSLP